MTSLSTQIVVDDDVLEYEPGQHNNVMFAQKAHTGVEKPKFSVIHDLDRPRSQSLCLVKRQPVILAQPVEPAPSPSPMKIGSQWRLEVLLSLNLGGWKKR